MLRHLTISAHGKAPYHSLIKPHRRVLCSTFSMLVDPQDKKNPAPNKLPQMEEIKRIYSLYKPEKKQLALSMAALSTSTVITMCVPAGMGKVIDIVSGMDPVMSLTSLTGILGGMFAVGSLSNIVRVHVTNMIGERISVRLRNDLYSAILKQEMGFFDKTRTGELINRLSSDVSIVGDVLSDSMAHGLRSTGQAIGSVSMLYVICPKLALVMLGVVPPIAIGAVSYGRFVKKLSKQVQSILAESTELAEERLSNIRIVRWFTNESKESQLYQQKLSNVLKIARKRSLSSATFFGSVDFSVKMSTLMVLGYGGQLVGEGLLSVGDLTSFLMYTIYVGFSFAGISSFYSELMKGVGSSSRIFELLEREPQIVSKYSSLENGLKKIDPTTFQGRICFENVSFAYPSRPDAHIFDNLNLEIHPNETLALVGPSGCGKSTIGALLARFYELEKGKISIDGVDISEMDPVHLRSYIGAVSQEPPLFATSIAKNISYGLDDNELDDKVDLRNRIVSAAKSANADQFICNLPEQYETSVGERGQSLSGGQKQRVAIARALIRQPKILILDEATSALDSESEMLVQDAIDKAKHNRTVILVSHRLSTIKSADRIAVVCNGQIVEQGTFEELSKHQDSVFSQIILKGHDSQ